MEVSLKTNLDNNIINDTTEQFTVEVCFKYLGTYDLPVDVSKYYGTEHKIFVCDWAFINDLKIKYA